MGSSKNNNNRSINDHSPVLHRLDQALNLGTRNGKNWQCHDIQIQRQVVRSIAAFLELIENTRGTLHHLYIKDTIPEMVNALVWILEHTNAATLGIAVDTTVKLVSILPDLILKSYALELVSPLSLLVSNSQTEVAMLSAKALSLTLESVAAKDVRAVWAVLERNETVRCLIGNVHCFFSGAKPVEYFQLMVSLLSTILQRWPRLRFAVWSDGDVMRKLNVALANAHLCGEVELLRLFSVIEPALCGGGAVKLLENGKPFLERVVQCMGGSQPHSVRIEAFKLAQCLAMKEERFSKMMGLYCKPIVEAIVSGMSKASMSSGEVSSAEISVAVEACRLGLITRWAGQHHEFFWKHRIGNVLLDLLFENSRDWKCRVFLPLEKQYSIALKGLNSNRCLVLRNYVWDILGWLAIHGEKGFVPKGDGHKFSVHMLILSACSASICQTSIDDTLRSESATRALLMMIYSPCKYIASQARSVLSEIVKRDGRHILEHFLLTMKHIISDTSCDRRRVIIHVMALSCYIGLNEPRNWVCEFSGLDMLLTFVRWCMNNRAEAKTQCFSPYLHNSVCGPTCCDAYSEEWEGQDGFLFYSLWGLAELINHLGGMKIAMEVSSGETKYSVPELISSLEEVCVKVTTPGVRWLASYALSLVGLYGFPSRFAARLEKVLSDTDLADMRLVLKTGEHLSAHGVVLAIRCPLLLSAEMVGENPREIRLSGCVDHEVFVKLLEFVYLGCLRANEKQHTTALKTLARHCNLQALSQTLEQQQPSWGSLFPSCDLSLALGPLGHRFSDVILESKATQLPSWACQFCPSLAPHLHLHKVILAASCDYLRALFNSGMQESFSQTIKLDLSWNAMIKLISWFYTDELPKPPSGCSWDNLSVEAMFHELEPYVELSSVANSWFLETVEEVCSDVIASYLESDARLSVKIVRAAYGFSLWKIVEAALGNVVPSYRQLCDAGELENFEEPLVDLIRSASVQYTQGNLQMAQFKFRDIN